MNPQEAFNHIKQRIQVNIDCINETNEALHVIQNLIDKATPQKPLIIGSPADYNEICPNCNESVDIFADSHFCQQCGQTLDWSGK